MREQSLIVYQNLYQITKENMQKAGKEMDFTEAAFVYGTQEKRGEADMLELTKLDNPSFIQSCYIAFFYRIPDEGAAQRWHREYGMSRTDFQKKVVKSLTNSQEFLDKQVVLKNNIYSDSHMVNYKVEIERENVTGVHQGINRLYGYYKKMPKFVRTIIRRIAGLKD